MIIDQWAIIDDSWSLVDGCSLAAYPSEKNIKLYGFTYNHPKFEDGSSITTSSIIEIKDGCATTRNSKYKLGSVSIQYAKKFPQYRELINHSDEASVSP